jgi:protein SCO1
MAGRPEAAAPRPDPTTVFDGAFRLVVVLAGVLVVLMMARLLGDAAGGGEPPTTSNADGAAVLPADPAATPTPDPADYLDPFPRSAPPIELTGPDGTPVSLSSYLGAPVLVFFGYTHCPDVCPVTIGAVGEAIDAGGGGAKAVFVTVDPERDTVPWLAEFVRYMPTGFTAVTGSAAEIRSTADAWGVRYARVEEADPDAYSMAHTADVFVIDGAGQFRARLPFGTSVEAMTAVLHAVETTTPSGPKSDAPQATTAIPSPGPDASPDLAGPAPGATPSVADPVAIWPQAISSSVWAGGASPIILALFDDDGARWNDPALQVTAQLMDGAGTPVGPAVAAVAVQPLGVADVSYVPTVDIPSAGRWDLVVETLGADGTRGRGIASITALDPGGTAALGAPAPAIRTATAGDYGGDQSWVTTDPLPDPRLTATSTSDALAAGRPFVLVVDSIRFRVTPVCGRAVIMAKQLVDRWGATAPFIHHEPYRFTVVTTEPVLEGTLEAPHLTDVADAWGVGSAPWGVGSMPWIFVVDGSGVVRAKYQGVMGTADIDVMLSLLVQES